MNPIEECYAMLENSCLVTGAIILAWFVINYIHFRAECKRQYQKGYEDGVKATDMFHKNKWGR